MIWFIFSSIQSHLSNWERQLQIAIYNTTYNIQTSTQYNIINNNTKFKDKLEVEFVTTYTRCPRRNGQNFGRVFLMLNYTDITQNTYIQSWTVTEIMTIEMCVLLGCPRTVRHPWRHTRPLRMPGNETPLANIVIEWLWWDNGTAAACVNYFRT